MDRIVLDIIDNLHFEYTGIYPFLLLHILLMAITSIWMAKFMIAKFKFQLRTTTSISQSINNSERKYNFWMGELLSEKNTFYKMLSLRANSDNVIYLASVDSSFVDMAINMYVTSFRKFGIRNFLYVCSDPKALTLLAEHDIDCFLYRQYDTDNYEPALYSTPDFIRKMRVKMKIMLASLMLGFTTVLTDVDVVFFSDPTPYLQTNADVSFMSDIIMDNCGFYVASPTEVSISLHVQVLETVMTRLIPDQKAMKIVSASMAGTLKKQMLDLNRFACGVVYFERGKRMFKEQNTCRTETCITKVVHNNWIVSKAAKVYRFKETGLWQYDHHGYYSSPSRKYLTYSNPKRFGNRTKSCERTALKTALTISKLLNRTLILPKFHCDGCKIRKDACSLNTHFNVLTFDKYFKNSYREHVFLSHELVPEEITTSISPSIDISSEYEERPKSNITTNYFLNWFQRETLKDFSVLRFQELYFEFVHVEKEWTNILNSALEWSNYRQVPKRKKARKNINVYKTVQKY